MNRPVSAPAILRCISVLFSEPKIPQLSFPSGGYQHNRIFQCSSASRKFLNRLPLCVTSSLVRPISVLFSEPKIPQSTIVAAFARLSCDFSALQRAENSSIALCCWSTATPARISVLFSEPKIPQLAALQRAGVSREHFSALQRAENSSIDTPARSAPSSPSHFSALQRAENSSM